MAAKRRVEKQEQQSGIQPYVQAEDTIALNMASLRKALPQYEIVRDNGVAIIHLIKATVGEVEAVYKEMKEAVAKSGYKGSYGVRSVPNVKPE